MNGPSDDTQRRYRRQNQFDYYPEEPNERIFKHAAKVYSDIMSSKNIIGDVLTETAEDETVIISKIEWDIKRDEGWGWCGREEEGHVCVPNFVHEVGDDENSYSRLVTAFEKNRKAGHARAIIINPIHIDLPPFVILLQAVCNKFTSEMVRNQWNNIKTLYNDHLLCVLGPLVGHASDGDSRRRKLMLENSTSKLGERYKIKHENFTHSGLLVDVAGKKLVQDLSDQDFIHNAKKLVNHLMHPSKVLSLGGQLCHMNHIQFLLDCQSFSAFDHGLQQSDVDRPDRMNWESAQRVLFPKVRVYLSKIADGAVCWEENVVGTMLYLEMVWKYVEIFYSVQASLTERVTNASYVCNFLRIWRLWVHHTKGMKLQTNFISRESFQDLLISCHHIVLFIRASRDFAPSVPICFQRLGSDVCEEYFSANGSFILNKHNDTITDMYRNLSHMQMLHQIYADKDGPDNPKKHRKAENIWLKGHSTPERSPDLQDFPLDEALEEHGKAG